MFCGNMGRQTIMEAVVAAYADFFEKKLAVRLLADWACMTHQICMPC